MRFPLLTPAAALAGTLLAGLLVTGAAPPPALTGEWGGLQSRLRLGATGGSLDFNCAAARLDTAIVPDATGRFTAAGQYEAFTPGPTRDADAPPALTRARFEGQITGTTLQLTMHLADGSAPQSFTFWQGRRSRLIRCL